MSIPKITQEQRDLMKRISVYALSTRPADEGKKEADVKAAMYMPIEKMCDFIDAIVESTNTMLTSIEGKVNEIQETQFETDSLTTQINHTFADNKTTSFTQEAQSVKLVIPNTITKGFTSEVIFKTGATSPKVEFVNESSKQLYKMQFGSVVGAYTPPADARVHLYCYCDDDSSVLIIILDVK